MSDDEIEVEVFQQEVQQEEKQETPEPKKRRTRGPGKKNKVKFAQPVAESSSSVTQAYTEEDALSSIAAVPVPPPEESKRKPRAPKPRALRKTEVVVVTDENEEQQQKELDTVRHKLHQAIMVCSDPTGLPEWTKICKMPKEQVEGVLARLQLDEALTIDADFTQSISDSLGEMLDSFFRGEGCIRDRVKENPSISRRVKKELGGLGLWLSNRVLLTAQLGIAVMLGMKEKHRRVLLAQQASPPLVIIDVVEPAPAP